MKAALEGFAKPKYIKKAFRSQIIQVHYKKYLKSNQGQGQELLTLLTLLIV